MPDVTPIVLQQIDLDIVPGKIPPIVHVSEYDTGRNIVVNLFKDVYPFVSNSIESYNVKVEGSIGKYGFSENAAWADDAEGVVVVHLTEAMTAIHGRVWTKIKLIKSESMQISTCGFWLDVDRAGVNAQDVVEAKGFTEQIQDAVDDYLDEHGSGLVRYDESQTITSAQKNQARQNIGAGKSTVSMNNNILQIEDIDRATAQAYRLFTLPSGGERGQALLSDGANGANWGNSVIEVDTTFSIAGKAADAKVTGEKISALKSVAESVVPLLSIGTVAVADNYGNHLVDNDLDVLVGSTYLFKTDATLTEANMPADAKATGEAVASLREDLDSITEVSVDTSLSVEGAAADAKAAGEAVAKLKSDMGKSFLDGFLENGLPVVYLNHPDLLTLKTKKDGKLSNVEIIVPSRRINEKLKQIKVQGASSQAYPKKNYTLTFKDNVTINPNWGSHKKYVIKADWVDFSHMRNIVGAKIWGMIRRTRINEHRALLSYNGNHLADGSGNHLSGETDPSLSMGMNFGAVDGYPVCVVINGDYWGIYSLNMPKDDWMAGMLGDEAKQCIVSAEQHSTATAFHGLVNPIDGEEMTDVYSGVVAFTLEYVGDDDETSWISTAINTLISSVKANYGTDAECEEAISEYLDIDSAIDYYIFACLLNHVDGTDKNYLLDSWDGTKWYFMAYDMDGTFGNRSNGKSYVPVNGGVTFSAFASANRLMQVIKTRMANKLKQRYEYLRNGVLSDASISDLVYSYAVQIPRAAFNYEGLLWPSRPGTNTSNHEQIIQYYTMRAKALDAEISTL